MKTILTLEQFAEYNETSLIVLWYEHLRESDIEDLLEYEVLVDTIFRTQNRSAAMYSDIEWEV